MNAASPTGTLDRRDADRVPYAARVMVVRGEAAWFTQLRDMSENGCGVFRPGDCTLVEEEIVRLFFYPDAGATAIIVPGRVARVDDRRIGIEYHDPHTVPPTRRTA